MNKNQENINNSSIIEDNLIKEIQATKLWRCKLSSKQNQFFIYSNMKGFFEGRYRMEIDKLKRRVEGKIYKVRIYWTPYNPNYLKYEGRVNNYTELIEAIKTVNEDLLDVKRMYTT